MPPAARAAPPALRAGGRPTAAAPLHGCQGRMPQMSVSSWTIVKTSRVAGKMPLLALMMLLLGSCVAPPLCQMMARAIRPLPAKPKRPMQAKYFWTRATGIYTTIGAKYPDLNATEKLRIVGKQVREKWNALDAKAKQKWDKQAEEARKVYLQEMEVYKEESAALKPPKRPLGARMLYFKENYDSISKQHPDKKSSEMMAVISKQWSKVSEKGKAPYEAKANELKLEWYKAMEEYCREEAELDAPDDMPRRRQSGYMFFMNDCRGEVSAENPGMDMIGLTKLMAKKWNSLSDADKKPYEELAQLDKERYLTEVEEYEARHGQQKPAAKKQRKVAPDTDMDSE